MPSLAKVFGRKRSDSHAASIMSKESETASTRQPASPGQSPNIAAAAPPSAGAAASPLTSLKSNGSVTSLVSTMNTTSISRQNSGATGHRGEPKRFELVEGGGHVHRLKNARRQEKLGRMLREMMGERKKVGDDAVSAVTNLVGVGPAGSGQLSLMSGLVTKLKDGQIQPGLVNGSSNGPKKGQPTHQGQPSPQVEINQMSLVEKYGKCHEVIGKGSYGTVRVAHRLDPDGHEMLYAVKEFKKRSAENEESFRERLMSEFCISSSLRHHNIIDTLDLMQDAHGGFCEVMEFCPGGDLYSLILSTGTGLIPQEADCFFKQILRGVSYMHSMGVAHCDLKPENVLLTQDGVCKISDFGNGECFRMAWEKSIHMVNGVCGSGPYIAPEEFKNKPFDPRAVDIWACGIIYMVMRSGSYLWRTAVAEEDENFLQYVTDRKTSKGYGPIEKLSFARPTYMYVIYSILDPVPSRRLTGKQVLNSEWGRSIKVCEAGAIPDSTSGHGSAEEKKEVLAVPQDMQLSTPEPRTPELKSV